MKTLDQNVATVTFPAKNMTKPVHFYCEAPKAKDVHLVGDFNDWNPGADSMTRRVDGWWLIELNLAHGHHQYRFLVDGKPTLDPHASGVSRDDKGEEASVIAVS